VIRMVGIREGLSHEHAILEKIRTSPTLEVGSIIGIFLMAAGLYFGFDALMSWHSADYGPLEVGELLRTISLSTMLIMMGGVTFMTSLILGFLALPTREQRL